MNKMQMAHEMALELVKIKPSLLAWQIADRCFEYADAMQAEADKRVNKERPEVLKEEWHPDWSKAPDTATHWTMRPDGKCLWWKGKPLFDGSCFYDAVGICHTVGYAPSFNYQGNWQDSLRKRPQ